MKKTKSSKAKKSAVKMKDLQPVKSPKGGAQKKEVGDNALGGGTRGMSANGLRNS